MNGVIMSRFANTQQSRILGARRELRPILEKPCEQFAPKALFDIYNRTADSFKVRGYADHEAWIGGATPAVTAGAAGKKLDEVVTLTQTTYVCIKVVMSVTVTVTLELLASKPTPGDTTEYFVLWIVPWAAGKIDWANLFDNRQAIHISHISGS